MGEKQFELISPFEPRGSQPDAIASLVKGVESGLKKQTLLGVTGSGKTFTVAHAIQQLKRPTLVLAHNKTLAAQLCNEFREFFPNNAVHYFVSYYDYYQPEAYVAQTDTYIEKDASINDEIDRLRHAATSALLERRDVIIVASISCIYGLGSPEDYAGMTLNLENGEYHNRDDILKRLVEIQYERNDIGFERGTFRVRGDTIEIIPVYGENVIRIELFGDEVERIREVDSITGEVLEERNTLTIYPGSHFVTTQEKLAVAKETIQAELKQRLKYFNSKNKLLEAQRLDMRTKYDLEMIQEMGYCSGIENYSRHMSGREPGSMPSTLLDFFPDDFLFVIDESHQSIPQSRGMYKGDKARKVNLVDHGFRLPSAMDNRPLMFNEFEQKLKQVIFVSATPGPYENQHSEQVVEQIIRPTGLIDPEVSVKPIEGQIDDLLEEIRIVLGREERALITTLTKKMAEDLTDYLVSLNYKARYLHSEIDTLQRIEILRDLRLGEFDVLVGINLLREGLDLPEVSLVAILDADKEGFLRSETSLVQTIGRAARNLQGKVVLYADKITDSMDRALKETSRRRQIQLDYNEEHGITPESIKKEITDIIQSLNLQSDEAKAKAEKPLSSKEMANFIHKLEDEMVDAAKKLEFERAAQIRDEIKELRKDLVGVD